MAYIKWIIILVLVLAVFFSGFFIRGCGSKTRVLKQSNAALISGNKSREVTYTTDQVKDFLAFNDSLAKAQGIKTRQLDKILEAKIRFSDSVRIANRIIKALTPDGEIEQENLLEDDVRYFEVAKDCYKITGVSYKDSTILKNEFNSDITIMLYWEYNKPTFLKRILTTKGGFSMFDFSWYNDAISVLNCNGDTLSVNKNINIIRR